ncbi:MAG TPA: FkbM family methyltransferase [Acidimicrobiia bacterium]
MLISLATLQGLGVFPKKALHVGAHTGEEAEMYAAAGCDVVWVEAQQHLADQLAEQGHDVRHAAIWSIPTLLTFHVTSNGQSSSLLPLSLHKQRYPDISVTQTHMVETTTIDALDVDVDFLNLDIQGAELEALKGATRTLPGVNWIYTEVSTEQLYQDQPLHDQLTDWLAARGFKKSLTVLTDYGWGDCLYVRSGLDGDN